MSLAPIGISTYSRLSHLEQTIGALKRNTLALDSELYVFSDAPQKGDEEKIAKVREYIHSIEGFKKIHIIERAVNGRVANNRGGINQLLDEYGKMIWLEEDIVTARGFLAFMNDALDFYEDDKNVLSITGYCPPFRGREKSTKDAFILQRFNGWGFASWKVKFNPFEFDLKKHNVDTFLNDRKAIKRFEKNGADMYQMLLAEHSGRIDALDVKLMYYEYKYNMFTLYPSKSLVQNIGHDGSGVHCGTNDKYHHDELWGKFSDFKFVKNIQVDEAIRRENFRFRFRNLGIKSKIIYFSRKIGIYPLLKKIKDLI